MEIIVIQIVRQFGRRGGKEEEEPTEDPKYFFDTTRKTLPTKGGGEIN